MRSRLSTLLSLPISFMPLSAGAFEGEDAYRAAQVACAVVAEMHFFQRADAIREISTLRLQLDKEPFLDGYTILNRAIDAEICVNLALNEPDWRDRLEQIEAEKAQREAEAINSASQTNTQSGLAVPKPDPKVQEVELAQQTLQDLEVALATDRPAQEGVQGISSDTAAAIMQRAIINQWTRPPSARNGMRTALEIALAPTGDVVGVTVLESSGNVAFDRSAINAVEKAARFPEVQQLDRAIFERDWRSFKLIFQPYDLKY